MKPPIPLMLMALATSMMAGCPPSTRTSPGDTGDHSIAPRPATWEPPTEPVASAAPQPSVHADGRPFRGQAPWYRDVSTAPLEPTSREIITTLQANGGWGAGAFRIDYAIHVLTADETTPMRTFVKTDDFYEPHCDHVPVPVPVGGAIEAETGYRCTQDGDCHLLVVRTDTNVLYEMWRADIRGDEFKGGCVAVWDLNKPFGPDGRGQQCSSADAAGLPITPLLFTAEEVASKNLAHAIRFILPNDRIRHRTYVSPATHATGAAKAGEHGVPYGARFRLRADYPLDTLPSDGARTVARALQRYGMILADGGQIALTAQSDRTSAVKWEGLLAPRDLSALKVTDFEVLAFAGGARAFKGDCRRVQ